MGRDRNESLQNLGAGPSGQSGGFSGSTLGQPTGTDNGLPWNRDPGDEDGSGGGGYGYGGGSSGPTAAQEKLADINRAIYNESAKVPQDYLKNMFSVYDQADKAIDDSADTQIWQTLKTTSDEWFSNLVKTQNSAKQTLKKAVLGASGSWIKDYLDSLGVNWDLTNAAIDEALSNNIFDIMLDAGNAHQQNANARGELSANADQQLKNQWLEYLANTANVHPDLVEDMFDTEGDEKDYGTSKSMEDAMKEVGWEGFKLPDNYDYSKLRDDDILPPQTRYDTFRLGLQGKTNSRQAANRNYWESSNLDRVRR